MERPDSPFEIHLQNGFRDDPVEVLRDGVVEAQVTATTRFQIGAADVLRVPAADGDEITIRLPDSGDEVSVTLTREEPYILVQNEAGHLQVETTEQSPRYA